MHNKLATIIAQKKQEIALLENCLTQPQQPLTQFMREQSSLLPSKDFTAALKTRSIIAEIKRRSPSKGALATISQPSTLACHYATGGAGAISVLTDQQFFAGHLQDLVTVADALKTTAIPILRKDFVLSPLQIAEAKLAGADAILLIVAVVGDQLSALLQYAGALNLHTLVEVHNANEINQALAAGAKIIGINNRDLTNFSIDQQHALRLRPLIPDDIITVAESGIDSPQWVHRYFDAGFNAVLIGEALVKADDPEAFIQACRHGY